MDERGRAVTAPPHRQRHVDIDINKAPPRLRYGGLSISKPARAARVREPDA